MSGINKTRSRSADFCAGDGTHRDKIEVSILYFEVKIFPFIDQLNAFKSKVKRTRSIWQSLYEGYILYLISSKIFLMESYMDKFYFL